MWATSWAIAATAAKKALEKRYGPGTYPFAAGFKNQQRLVDACAFKWEKQEPCLPEIDPNPDAALKALCRQGFKERFTAPVFGVLGVPIKPGSTTLDADLGRGERAFRTPTVRNVVATAPYFHNGGFPKLTDVVDFYDKGGGHVPGQDPDVRPLALTAEERRTLLVFLTEGLRERAD